MSLVLADEFALGHRDRQPAPAVLVASHSHVPLIVLTADRPAEMRGTGASQTTDQIKLFGSAVRLFAEIGTPPLEVDSTPSANCYWRSLVCRAVASAATEPVHLTSATSTLADLVADAGLPELTETDLQAPGARINSVRAVRT